MGGLQLSFLDESGMHSHNIEPVLDKEIEDFVKVITLPFRSRVREVVYKNNLPICFSCHTLNLHSNVKASDS